MDHVKVNQYMMYLAKHEIQEQQTSFILKRLEWKGK